MPNQSNPFLYDFQMEAVKKARNGSILNGSVGSGKSRTGLFYYFKEQGGWIEGSDYTPMKNPKDLYIITTAKKRDSLERILFFVYQVMLRAFQWLFWTLGLMGFLSFRLQRRLADY